MLADAALSILCSFIAFWTWWLGLSLLILLPLSVYFAFRFYKKMVARFRSAPILARVCGLVPMAIALATLPAIMVFFEGTYRA